MSLALTVKLIGTIGNWENRFVPAVQTITLSGTARVENEQAIGTGAEALVVGEVATAGFAVFENKGPGVISISSDSNVDTPLLKLNSGESFPVRLATATVYAKATVASNLAYVIYSN